MYVSATGSGPKNTGKEKVRNVKTLKTKNLIVGGFLNDINVPTLEKYALRKSGKQDITAETYYFDRVESELLDTDRLSGKGFPFFFYFFFRFSLLPFLVYYECRSKVKRKITAKSLKYSFKEPR